MGGVVNEVKFSAVVPCQADRSFELCQASIGSQMYGSDESRYIGIEVGRREVLVELLVSL